MRFTHLRNGSADIQSRANPARLLKTVAQLSTSTLLTPYLPLSNGQSAATTMVAMQNQVQPKLYSLGDWHPIVTKATFNVAAGYVVLPIDYECILGATLNENPVEIQSIAWEFRVGGTGPAGTGASHIYGLVDQGMVPTMSDPPDEGIDELIFTCSASAFASGDTVTVTYTDTDEGYAQVVLPLNAIAVTISAAASGGTDAVTGEVLTTLTVTSSTGLVAGLGLAITQLTGTDATYIDTFRIHSVPNGTSVKIVKSYVALTGTIAGTGAATLMPVSTIESIESMEYASLPARVVCADEDDTIYAVMPAGDGVTEFRRYECPQVPSPVLDSSEWTLNALVKRKFIPLTSTADFVRIDSIPALKHGMLAVVAEDNGDLDRAEAHWKKAKSILSSELFDTKGGVKEIPTFDIWGVGVSAMPSKF